MAHRYGHRWRNLLLIGVFASTVFVGGLYPHRVSADCWGCTLASQFVKQVLEGIARNLEGVIMVGLKTQAINLINSQIEQLIGGVNGSGLLFISDWQQYLFEVPREQNALFVQDFLSQSTRGKCSSLNFQSVETGPLKASYLTQLCKIGGGAAIPRAPVVTIDQYCPNPARSMREGDWRCFNAVLSNPANNPIGYSLIVAQAQARDLARRQAEANAKAIANQGYKGVEVAGVTVTPGRTVAALTENVKSLGNQIITAAQNPAELLAGVVTSIANRAINQMLQKGFDKARTAIERETGKLNQQIYKTSREVNETLGPASRYLQTVNQQLGNVNNTQIRTGGAPPKCVAAGGCFDP